MRPIFVHFCNLEDNKRSDYRKKKPEAVSTETPKKMSIKK